MRFLSISKSLPGNTNHCNLFFFTHLHKSSGFGDFSVQFVTETKKKPRVTVMTHDVLFKEWVMRMSPELKTP